MGPEPNATYVNRFGVWFRGRMFTLKGWRATNSTHAGPGKEGVRSTPNVDQNEVEALTCRWTISLTLEDSPGRTDPLCQSTPIVICKYTTAGQRIDR